MNVLVVLAVRSVNAVFDRVGLFLSFISDGTMFSTISDNSGSMNRKVSTSA
ncbi:MAG: hypothetical protein LBH80_08565 [Prevotellaceae bacterium]|jgi:hypothetical protein|nr:hypothetical protein [Prevotellaceae bacterium]